MPESTRPARAQQYGACMALRASRRDSSLRSVYANGNKHHLPPLATLAVTRIGFAFESPSLTDPGARGALTTETRGCLQVRQGGDASKAARFPDEMMVQKGCKHLGHSNKGRQHPPAKANLIHRVQAPAGDKAHVQRTGAQAPVHAMRHEHLTGWHQSQQGNLCKQLHTRSCRSWVPAGLASHMPS